MAYDEHSIQVLGEAHAAERFGYTKIRELCRAYPTVAEEHIERLVIAAEMSGWGVAQAEERYLAKQHKNPPPAEFTAIFRELMLERHPRAAGAPRD